MRIVIAEKEYDVDVQPLKENAAVALKKLIADKEDGNDTLRFLVKQACVFAKGKMGLKADRNADPIELVIGHLANMIIDSIDKQGLTLQGTEAGQEETAHVDQN